MRAVNERGLLQGHPRRVGQRFICPECRAETSSPQCEPALSDGGQRNGSLAPAMRDRNIMGLMPLSSSCARSVDLLDD